MEHRDPFRQRLDDVNGEMLRLLEGAQKYSHDLQVEEDALLKASGATRAPSIVDRSGGWASVAHRGGSADLLPRVSLGSEAFQREVERQVAACMQSYTAQIRQMVEKEFDARTQDFELSLRSRLSDLKGAHDAITEGLKEVARTVEDTRSELLEKIAGVESTVGRKIANVERECSRMVKQVDADIAEMRDLVAALEAEKKSDARSGARRLDELTTRHKELLQDALSAIDQRVGTVRHDHESATRDLRKLQLEEMDSLNRYVVKLQATSAATEETLQKMHAQLSSLFDGHGITRSQLRMIEQQMSRVESMSRQAGKALPLATGGGSTGGTAVPSPADMFRMQQDIYALKQSVSFLYNQQQQQQQSAANNGTSSGPGVSGGGVGASSSARQHADPNLVAPLRTEALRPPYVPSNRSTPTKGGYGTSAGGQRYSAADSPTVRSPNSKQFVTVLEDSEDEYENSKLANSALD